MPKPQEAPPDVYAAAAGEPQALYVHCCTCGCVVLAAHTINGECFYCADDRECRHLEDVSAEYAYSIVGLSKEVVAIREHRDRTAASD